MKFKKIVWWILGLGLLISANVLAQGNTPLPIPSADLNSPVSFVNNFNENRTPETVLVDHFGRVIRRAVPNGIPATYEYDKNGNLTEVTLKVESNNCAQSDSETNLNRIFYKIRFFFYV